MKKSRLTILVLSLAFLLGGINCKTYITNVELNFDREVKKASEPTSEDGKVDVIFGSSNIQIASDNVSINNSADYRHAFTINTEGASSYDNEASDYSLITFSNEAVTKSVVIEFDLLFRSSVKNFSLELGGDGGNISVTLDDVEMASGTLDGSESVKVEQSISTIKGSKLIVSITNITSKVKIYGLSYTFTVADSDKAFYNISQLETKAQLKYSFDYDGEDKYSFYNMKVNFGAVIDNDLLSQMIQNIEDYTIASYGIALAKSSSLAKDETVSSLSEAVEANDKTYVSSVNVTYSSIDKIQSTNKDGTETSGNYKIFTANLGIEKVENYTVDVVAVAYFVFEKGNYLFLQERKLSVSSLAQAYIDNTDVYNNFEDEIQGSLQYLASLSATEA